jgi:hypothetical protein
VIIFQRLLLVTVKKIIRWLPPERPTTSVPPIMIEPPAMMVIAKQKGMIR